MHSAEIIVNRIEGNCMTKIIDLLGERISQPGKPPHLHSHGEVLTFNVTRGDVLWIGPAGNRCRHSSNALSRTVPSFGFGRHPVKFNQGCIIDFRTESILLRLAGADPPGLRLLRPPQCRAVLFQRVPPLWPLGRRRSNFCGPCRSCGNRVSQRSQHHPLPAIASSVRVTHCP